MSSSRSPLPLPDGRPPEADSYDDNWLTTGIDPLLHPGWEALRRLAADEHRHDFGPRDRLRMKAVSRWLRRQFANLGRATQRATGGW